MGRGGRSSGGGRSSYRSTPRAKAPAPAAAPKAAPAPAVQSGGGSILGNLGSTIVDAWVWGSTVSMAHRAMDAIMGPRTFQVDHTTSQLPAAAAPAPGSEPSNACDVHNLAFQDCINHNGSDISKCQFYIDILNDCRRRGQTAVVETYG
ncbi:hypothetical protein EJB05_00028 [Eragrostis curvula]|uniref:CHCH domain-containing protein n=1 Tax=Eragrostis curvula TaxID=38414 RepID=A0A5J9WLK5_9POAL|nr:hypothetical protein EJB05_00028 [Eragrostis curvula]